MTFLLKRLAVLTSHPEMRENMRELLRYLVFLGLLITAYAVLFHVIMLYVEGQAHSWLTGFYWTLVVMTTLGFGDVTFASDVGRVFSVVVLLSGVVFLLVMLPFLFIRLFYTPWLEARVRILAPREAPPAASGHVIIIEYDAIAVGLVQRLAAEGVSCFTIAIPCRRRACWGTACQWSPARSTSRRRTSACGWARRASCSPTGRTPPIRT